MSRKVLSKRYKSEQQLATKRRRMARHHIDSETDVLMTSFTHPPPRRSEDDIQVVGSLPSTLDRSVIDLTSPESVFRPGSITPPLQNNEVVDLTEASPVILESARTRRRRQRNNNHVMLPSQRDNILVLGDSDDENDVQVLPSSSPHSTRSTHPHLTEPVSSSSSSDTVPASTEGKRVITCPVCMEDEPTIHDTGDHLTSTTCGHIFCNTCIRGAINTQHKCPTCRKRLTMRQIHPIFL